MLLAGEEDHIPAFGYCVRILLSTQRGLVHVSVEEGLIPTLPSLLSEAVFIGSLAERAHGVSGDVYRVGVKTLIVTMFNYDGTAPGRLLFVSLRLAPTI